MPLWIICPFRYCGKSSSAEAGADGDGVGDYAVLQNTMITLMKSLN